MRIISSAFENNKHIPEMYGCEGKDVNPPLEFYEVPDEAVSLALIMDDPDAPSGVFTHWLIWNLDPQTERIEENAVITDAVEGKNDFGFKAYGGPCPPAGHPHRYFFKLYALKSNIDLDPEIATKSELEEEIEKNMLEKAELIGLYQRL